MQLVQLQKDLKKIEDSGTQVIGISYDSVEVLAKFAEKKQITFPLLSDPDSNAIKAFGIFNKEAKGKQAGIPHAGTFVIDNQGVIRAKLFREGVMNRHSTEDLIKAVQAIK